MTHARDPETLPVSEDPTTPMTWGEFREAGMLWWANRTLHLFGWAIVVQLNANGEVVGAEPRRAPWRGFEPAAEARGFERLTRWLAAHVQELVGEVEG